MKKTELRHILISRTDSIGDVALTLPLAGILKEKYPHCKISFLGTTYTQPLLKVCVHVDEVLEWDLMRTCSPGRQVEILKEKNIDVFIHVFPCKEIAHLAKKAQIPVRIGTSHRWYHWLTCNCRVNFTRKNSPLHESQLNLYLLRPLGITSMLSLEDLFSYAGFLRFSQPSPQVLSYLSHKKKKIILHPKSQGSAKEWPVEQFMKLALQLAEKDYIVFFTGTEKEGKQFRDFIPAHPNIIDTTGRFSLNELISFIAGCDALVAASTGPLHIAGLLNKITIGLFSEQRPIHPGRWQPLGKKVYILTDNKPYAPWLDIEIARVFQVIETYT